MKFNLNNLNLRFRINWNFNKIDTIEEHCIINSDYLSIKIRIFDKTNFFMTVVIDKSNLKNTSKILNEKLKKSAKKGNLTKHFGKLKRNIDGLDYQISVRENED